MMSKLGQLQSWLSGQTQRMSLQHELCIFITYLCQSVLARHKREMKSMEKWALYCIHSIKNQFSIIALT